MIDQAVGCNTARVIKWSWSTTPTSSVTGGIEVDST